LIQLVNDLKVLDETVHTTFLFSFFSRFFFIDKDILQEASQTF